MEDYGVAKGYLELDISSLESNVKSAVKYLDDLDRRGALVESELNKLQSVTQKVGNVFQQAAQKSKVLSGQIDQAKQKCGLYEAEIKNLNTIIDRSQKKQKELNTEIEKATSKYERAEAKVKAVAEAHGKESEEYEKAVVASRKAQNELTQLKNEYDALGIEVEESGHKVVEFQTKLNNTQAAINQMSAELARAQSKAIQYGQVMQGAGEKIQNVGGTIDNLGNKLSMSLTAPLTAAGTASVKLAADAEKSFAKVSTIADSTALSYEKMESEVTEASNNTGVAITDFNEALYSSMSAGVESGKAIGFTTDMVKLAKGGFTDTAKAVDVVTSVLNAYGLSADQASSISDKLITMQNIGKTTVDELASSLGRVIPTAKAFNVDMDNVSASMAILTKRGIQTAEATTYYNSMLNELGKSGSVADKALRDLSGKGFSQLVAEGTPVTSILQMLSDEAAKNGQSLSDMFGSMEAGKAALSIMSDGGAEYNKVLEQMRNSANATQEAFDKMDSTDAAKMQKELVKLQNAGIKAGKQLLPVVTSTVEQVGNLAEKFNKLSPEEQKSTVKMAAFAAGMGPVLKMTGSVTTGVGSLTKGFGKLLEKAGDKKSLKIAEKGMEGVGAAAKIAASGTGVLTTAMSALTSPVGMTVAAVAALTAGAIAMDKAFGGSTERVYELSESQKAALDACKETTEALKEERQAREETVLSINREYTGYGALLSELQSITDENGRVKEGYESRAKVITGELSSALGAEIEMTDGVIQKYQETINAVKELIVQKKAEAIIASKQDVMSQSYEKSIELADAHREVLAALDEQTDKVAEAQMNYDNAVASGSSSIGSYDSVLKQAKQEQENLEKQVADSRNEMELFANEVNNCDALVEASASGNMADMEAAISKLISGCKSYSEEALETSKDVREEMYAQANDTIKYMQDVQSGLTPMAESTYQELSRTALNSILEFNKVPGGVGKALEEIGPEASKATADALAKADLSGQLDAEAKEEIDSFIKGLSGLDEETKEVWSQAWYGALEGLEGFESLADPAQEGADAFLESLKSALEVHSPSQAVRKIFGQVWPGASEGLEDGKDDINSKGSGVVSSFLENLLGEIDSGRPKVKEAVGAIGSEGKLAMQEALSGQPLNPPGVKGIASTTYLLGSAGNIQMGAGLRLQELAPPGVKDIANTSHSIGIAGNSQMGMGLKIANLDPPRINNLDGISKASKAREDMQSYFNNHPLSAIVNVVKKIGGAVSGALFADGGIATEPSIFGEDGPEMAIPLSTAKRSRALELYEQTGDLLGISRESSEIRKEAMNNISTAYRAAINADVGDVVFNAPEIDYDLLARKVAEHVGNALRSNPIQPVIEMKDGDVYLDNERVGRKQAPVISRIISQNT